MFIRLSLLLLLPLLAGSQTLRDSRHSSAYTFIYRLSNEEIRNIFRKSFDEAVLHTAVDSFPTDSVYRRKLPPGNYMFARADRHLLDCTILLVNDLHVELMKDEGAELAITVHDSTGKIIPDAKVAIDKRDITFNAEKQLWAGVWLQYLHMPPAIPLRL